MTIKYYKFTKGPGGMKVDGNRYFYLDKKGDWLEKPNLVRRFCSGDMDFDEITADEAKKMISSMKNTEE